VRVTAAQIQNIDVTEAFTATYNLCQANPKLCTVQISSGAIVKQRQDLSNSILLRAKAIETLGEAYKALKVEAEYDERADLVSATNTAIDGVNSFSASLLAIASGAPAAALIQTPLSKVSEFGTGLIADNRQRRRIISANKEISAVAVRLKSALEVEAYIFDSLSQFIEKNRTSAKQALLDAKVVSHSEILSPLIDSLELKPVKNIDATVAKSNATQTAVKAMLKAQSQNEVRAAQNRYRTSIAALNALVAGHNKIESKQGVELADLDRFLAELNTALEKEVEE